MKVMLVAVGRPRGLLAEPIAEYERRASRYFQFQAVEVKEQPSRREDPGSVMAEEGKRLLARVPAGVEVVALHRSGRLWASDELALYLSELALRASPGVAFVIGGAFGLSDELLRRADHRLSLSAMTMPHELARLVLSEQIYRAGTILRGEPYHKAADRPR
jgi:23S rRNA (pseudouridine1915-N3)-methyltransferase